MKIVIGIIVVLAIAVVALLLLRKNNLDNTKCFRAKVIGVGRIDELDESVKDLDEYKGKYDSYVLVNDGLGKEYYVFKSKYLCIEKGLYGEFKVLNKEVLSFIMMSEDIF